MSEEELEILRYVDCSSSEIETVNKAVDTIEKLQKENKQLKEDFKKEQYLVDKLTRQISDEYKNTIFQSKKAKQLKETNNCLNLQIANVTLLEKELKDKDEKISNLIKLLIEMVFDDIDYLGVYQELVARHLVKLGYIVKEDGYYKELESNKED